MDKKAVIALEDGSSFFGSSRSTNSIVCGELVFNTAMTGYQEVCTDPSYTNQMVVFSSTHIGNVGVNDRDYESNKTWLKAVIVREMSKFTSNWRSQKPFIDFLNDNDIPWIENVDTRKLVRHLQKRGCQNACLMIGNVSSDHAVHYARTYQNAKGLDLSQVAIQTEAYNWKESEVEIEDSTMPLVCVYDFGVKTNILRRLKEMGCRITVVPGNKSADDILALDPQGIVLSNGPGDPSCSHLLIEQVKKLVDSKVPLLGICFGFQLLGIAAGGKIEKMKFGHHGINHPVYDLKRQQVYITSQNHNFCLSHEKLPADLEVTHLSLFDRSIQGFRSKTAPLIAFQGHPEGSPGPQDLGWLFEEFFDQVIYYSGSKTLLCH